MTDQEQTKSMRDHAYRGGGAAEVVSAPSELPYEWRAIESRAENSAEMTIDPSQGTRVCYVDARDRELGSILVSSAESVDYEPLSRMDPLARKRMAVIVADDHFESQNACVAVTYLALRRARIWNCSTVLCLNSAGAMARLPFSLDRADSCERPILQRLDIAMDQCWQNASPRTRATLQTLFVDEAVETLDNWVRTFFASSWFEALYGQRLSKEQYIYTLSNLHQFVRWTTRLIGRAVSHAHDKELRDHWLEHLRDEINHELIIEKDLRNLGADPRYVAERMVPEPCTLQFMGIQESMIGLHADPVMFMASPFVAEGYGARLDNRFLDALEASASRWGIQKPKLVTSFYASHISYDGGNDGHWSQTRNILSRLLTEEPQLQLFLAALRAAADATERAYNAYMSNLLAYDSIQ